ncbi:MAG: DUF3592 domain-containing protein [Candidatus Obscuribacter sp.]|nr:DUF3592 domain-containing protein [Candidatus Obscuribacter sp.]
MSDYDNGAYRPYSYENQRRGAYQVSAFVSLLVAIGCLIYVIPLHLQEGWSPVSGRFIEAQAQVENRRVVVSYSYLVDGKNYQAKEIENSRKPAEQAAKLTDTYGKSLTIPVFYNPADPAQSRLGIQDLKKVIVFYEAVLLACLFIWLVSVLAWFSRNRSSESSRGFVSSASTVPNSSLGSIAQAKPEESIKIKVEEKEKQHEAE